MAIVRAGAPALLFALFLCSGDAFAQEPAEPALAADSWQARARLLDVRYDGAVDLSGPLAAGIVEMSLGRPVVVDGGRWDSVLVGHGWIRFQAGGGSEGAAGRDEAGLRAAGPRLGPRIDVLSGEGVRNFGGPVSWWTTPEGSAIRWSSLMLPGGGQATAELVIDRQGHLTAQYLRLPREAEIALAQGALRAGTSGPAGSQGLEPAPAKAFSLKQPVFSLRPPRVPGGPMRPMADGPPPMGCDPPAGSWCEQADGPDASVILIADSFDDLGSQGRGWTPAGLWHESTWPVCVGGTAGGASADPGVAWYAGIDLTCGYQDNMDDTLLSPTSTELVTNDTVMEFMTRIAKEEPFDVAEISFNGVPIGTIDSSTLDPNTWYNFRLDSVNDGAAFFTPYVGSTLQVGFRFTSDTSVSTSLGWMLDDVRVWDQAIANPNCLLAQNGSTFVPGCDQTVATTWSFNETDFCQGCEYTFYVLVECGREMHLPLWDMEGTALAVTNMVTGNPVSLRCRNQTALADAGLGPYPVSLMADCCGDPAEEQWWGPAFDETDNLGPGQVGWGFPDCPGLAVYDVDVPPDGVQCDELPCGGELSLQTPGESQVMDCFIEDAGGLCGLYRLDVTSGGFIWDLFANCDGTNTPQFQIFQDCTEAWTAFNPLPELAIANLTTSGGCPALDVDFEVQNIGCVDHPGDVLVRLQSDCMPTDSLDHLVAGPIPAGGSVSVSVPFVVGCAPVRVEVFADPDDAILECTESLTVASCAAEEGVDSLATFSCGCTANLDAQAGADLYSCPGEMVLLDGSASTIAPCAEPLYRWLDGAGMELAPWSADPTVNVLFDACPGGADYQLEVSCNGEACVDPDTVRIDCLVPVADAGLDRAACVGETVTLDGSGSTIPGCAQVEYRWLDPGGAEYRTWSLDPTVSLGAMDCALAGSWTVEVRCSTGGGCSDVASMELTCVSVVADVIPDEIFACEGLDFGIGPAEVDVQLVGCTMAEFRWLDAGGGAISAWDPDPSVSLVFGSCPAQGLVFLEARCADPGLETCGSLDGLVVTCPKPEAPIPTSTDRCGGPEADLACGVAEAGVTYAWDLDVLVDSSGDGQPGNDADILGCDVTGAWPIAGSYTVRAFAVEPLAGCVAFADLMLEVFDDPAVPTPSALPDCVGLPAALSCGVEDPALGYAWDVDLLTDSDGNGTPDDDADLSGCDVGAVLPEGMTTVRLTVTDARGCSASADLDVVVDPVLIPGEVTDLRIARAGDGVGLAWAAATDAVTYRVLRGGLGAWYSHAADDAAGQGACDTAGALLLADPDDAALGEADFYYLVTAVSACGGEGSAGFDSRAAERPARAVTASCP